MSISKDYTNVYSSFQGLSDLKRSAKENSSESLHAVAQQFEAFFLNIMLKNMRAASLGEDVLGSQQGDFYNEMFDQQIALTLSQGKGIGLADMLSRQFERFAGSSDDKNETAVSPNGLDAKNITQYLQHTLPAQPKPEPVKAEENIETNAGTQIEASIKSNHNPKKQTSKPKQFATPEMFIDTLWPLAQQAAAKLGVKPQVLLAQAALETGWGKAIIQQRDGTSSHNVFNIKADGRWTGKKAIVPTLEYIDGVAVRQTAAFRAYDSFDESFRDYVEFLQNNPRYNDALQQAQDPEKFIQALHEAGYATDPQYAQKIKRIVKEELKS
jgi:flagellar protein FlgJ